ncbi:hypothetical protein [Shewanella waksmanii]|uniref:hypothetical protein n=1 Tax=Shewanella waksmanii TaxID=213783 RepID=UPI00048FD4F5|nr:hypothetical protein [Shewanella waksmanii]
MLIRRSLVGFNVIFVTLLCVLVGCGKEDQTAKKVVEVDESLCQFSQGPCQQQIGELTVSLELTPTHAPSEKPIHLIVRTNHIVDQIDMQVKGRDMFMGIIPVNLQQQAKDVYQGELIYGSCSSNYMVWRAQVNVTTQGQTMSFWFDFLADNPL